MECDGWRCEAAFKGAPIKLGSGGLAGSMSVKHCTAQSCTIEYSPVNPGYAMPPIGEKLNLKNARFYKLVITYA